MQAYNNLLCQMQARQFDSYIASFKRTGPVNLMSSVSIVARRKAYTPNPLGKVYNL